MRRFFIVVYALTALFQVPFVLAVAWLLGRLGWGWGWAPAIALGAATVALLPGRVARMRDDSPISRVSVLLVEEPFFIHWCASLGASLFFLIAAPIAGLGSAVGLVRSAPIGVVAGGCYALAFAIAAFGVLVRRRVVRVREVTIRVEGLGEELEGYRIAQLSDLHIGSQCPRERAERWVRRANALEVDAVALTGDYVTSGVAFHETIASVLSQLRAKDGVFAVMGNHDYFGGGEPLGRLLLEGGVRLLRNERATIRRGASSLEIAGVDDTWTKRTDLDKTYEGFEHRWPLVMLAHDPDLFPSIAARGADLVLSGHTHWGQVAVPFLGERYNLTRLHTPYHAGLMRVQPPAIKRNATATVPPSPASAARSKKAQLYVNPGLGTTGPPIRVGAPPEITVLELRRA